MVSELPDGPRRAIVGAELDGFIDVRRCREALLHFEYRLVLGTEHLERSDATQCDVQLAGRGREAGLGTHEIEGLDHVERVETADAAVEYVVG